MSLLEKATIITTPTAHSNGKLHSIKGGTVADFDVVRGSAATRVNAEGLIESVATNIPRIDYTTGEGVVLLEPQSTNLITYSEDFSNAYWTKAGAVVSNGVVAPSGSNEAFNLLADNVTNQSYVKTDVSVTTSQTYTFSVFAKQGAEKYIALVNLNPFTNSFFDLESGVALGSTAVSSSIEDYGNGWFRCSVETIADTTTKFCGIYLSNNGTSLVSSSIPNGNGVQIWGAQVEALPYATSYIPTSGAIATRLADSLTGAGDATTFNSTEGVLYAEIAALSNDGTSRVISLSDSSDTNRVHLFYNVSNNTINLNYRVAGSSKAVMSYTLSDNTIIQKIAYRWQYGNFKLYVNGVSRGTDTNTVMMPSGTMNQLAFNVGGGGANFYGKTKTIAVFSEALTDEELTCLTTI